MKKKYLILSILFAFVFILTSCGAESDKPRISDDEFSTDIYIVTDGVEKKIVSYNYDFDTTDVVKLVAEMDEEVTKYYGGIENQTIRTSYAKTVYKVPKDNAKSFEHYLDVTLSKYLDDKELESENATGKYYDLESIIDTYQERIDYYQDLVDRETTTAEERVVYNDKIDELKAKILSYNKQKAAIDNATQYATFVVEVHEKEEPKTTGDKFKSAGMYVGKRLIIISPLCILACATYAFIVIINKKKENKNDSNNDNSNNNQE